MDVQNHEHEQELELNRKLQDTQELLHHGIRVGTSSMRYTANNITMRSGLNIKVWSFE